MQKMHTHPGIFKPRTGVFVANDDLAQDVITEARTAHLWKSQKIDSPGGSKALSSVNSMDASIMSRPVSPKETSKILLKQRRELEIKQKDMLLKQNIEKHFLEAREKQDREFPIIMDRVDKANQFLDTIDADLNLISETKKNKTRRQFEDWNIQVHGTIQKKIGSNLSKIESKELNRIKNKDFQEFLDITNRKAAIFSDIIIEDEYDPLQPNRRCIKARTGKISDPVKVNAQKKEREEGMLGIKKKKEKLCKDMLDVEKWRSGQIEATPYGTFAKLMNSQHQESTAKSKTMKSNVHFDHFNYPTGKEVMEKEMPVGKRIYPKTTHANPAKAMAAYSTIKSK